MRSDKQVTVLYIQLGVLLAILRKPSIVWRNLSQMLLVFRFKERDKDNKKEKGVNKECLPITTPDSVENVNQRQCIKPVG